MGEIYKGDGVLKHEQTILGYKSAFNMSEIQKKCLSSGCLWRLKYVAADQVSQTGLLCCVSPQKISLSLTAVEQCEAIWQARRKNAVAWPLKMANIQFSFLTFLTF